MGGACAKLAEIECRRPHCGEMRIAYKYKVGEFCARGGSDEFRDARAILPGLKTIGIYYDDPDQVDSKHQRYAVGVILSDSKDDFSADAGVEKMFEEKGYNFTTLPEVATAVQVSHPVNESSKIGYAIAACKVYEAFDKYIRQNKLRWNPAVEIYDGSIIHFMIPQSDGDKFYVPETKSGNNSETFTSEKKEWTEWHQ